MSIYILYIQQNSLDTAKYTSVHISKYTAYLCAYREYE